MAAEARSVEAVTAAPGGALRDFLLRLFRDKKIGATGLVIVLVFLIVGVFADVLAPYGMLDRQLANRLSPPSREFILGTDQFGRDLLSRIIYGAQISMIVGLGSSGLLVAISTLLGLLSGYLGGRFDLIVQRFVDAILSFPPLFIILTVMAVLRPGMVSIIVIIGTWWGIANTRTVRSVVLSVKESAYVEAARAIGCPMWRILWRHILPELVAPTIVIFTTSLGAAILMEATISFLGFGIPPPQPSWGGMLSLEGRQYMLQAPWLGLWPGVCVAVVVYGINMFGDAARDLLDPRLRGGAGRFGTSTVKEKSK